MKTHAFVRENIPKVLAYKEEGMITIKLKNFFMLNSTQHDI